MVDRLNCGHFVGGRFSIVKQSFECGFALLVLKLLMALLLLLRVANADIDARLEGATHLEFPQTEAFDCSNARRDTFAEN